MIGRSATAGGLVDEDLDVRLDTPLPRRLPVGRPTAIFVLGSCFHRRTRVRRVMLRVDGGDVQVTACGMPRVDLYRALHPTLSPVDAAAVSEDPGSDDDPHALSYRSGFWATVPVRVSDGSGVDLALRATLADGRVAEAPLGRIEASELDVVGAEPSLAARPTEARVAIAMATFDPDPELFRVQVESIRSQTVTDWICVVSDDCTPPSGFEAIRRELDDDDRFLVTRSNRRLGFYRNFERSLGLVPASVPFVALADHDDRWYPEKLETLLDRLGDSQLIYSDQRVVDPQGRVLADTYWTARRNNHTNLASLLIANTITGAASLFRRELLDLALPFPDPPGTQYHDHWLGLVAMSVGKVSYVDRPLYDYVQHGAATLGHTAANVGTFQSAAGALVARLRRGGFRRSFVGWRAAYFFGYTRIRLLAEVLLVRGGNRIRRRKRTALRRIVRSERSPVGFAWLALRGLRRLVGMNETLGAERVLVRGILWRYAVSALAFRRLRPRPGDVHGSSIPEIAGGVKEISVDHTETAAVARMIAPLELSISETVPERVNLLIPKLELKHLFGGYITKFNLARKLAEQGQRTRILTIDPTPPLPRSWREQITSYAGLDRLFDQVEVEFARDRDAPVRMNPDDALVATTWRTAHVANAALKSLERRRFLYLIQEYEPYTHAMGTLAALAMATYEFPHAAMFSTELLRGFFARHRYGVFAAGEEQGMRDSVAFENAITDVSPPTASELAARERKRLLFYARPESHGARNMFELGLLALAEAASAGVFGVEWDLHGIGAVERRDRIQLAPGRHLELLTRRDQRAYADLLAGHDVGLALMCTPHPSLVPIEMASAGMVTVTNSFDVKTPEAMAAISSNLITVPPTLDGVTAGLRQATERVDDHEARRRGAAVEWSRSWDESLNPELMRRVLELLAAC